MNTKYRAYLYFLGGAALILGVLMRVALQHPFAVAVFASGAALVAIYHFLEAVSERNTADFRHKRLLGLCFLASMLLPPAAYMMYKWQNTWIVLTLIYALAVLFLSFRGKNIKKNN